MAEISYSQMKMNDKTKIIIGDCAESLRSLDDGIIQTCITSPPYFGLRDYGVDNQIGLEKTPRYYYDQEAILEPCSPNTHARLSQNIQDQIGSTRANGGRKTNGNMKAVGRKFDTGVIWNKNNPSFDSAMEIMPLKRNKRSVWTVSTKPYKGAHFATFQIDLIEPCILAGSKPGDLVLDPFSGSGTVGQAALKHGRKSILCELNPEYEKLIIDRIEPGKR